MTPKHPTRPRIEGGRLIRRTSLYSVPREKPAEPMDFARAQAMVDFYAEVPPPPVAEQH